MRAATSLAAITKIAVKDVSVMTILTRALHIQQAVADIRASEREAFKNRPKVRYHVRHRNGVTADLTENKLHALDMARKEGLLVFECSHGRNILIYGRTYA